MTTIKVPSREDGAYPEVSSAFLAPLLAWLENVAASGESCPRNRVIERRLGSPPTTGSKLLRKLEKGGDIMVRTTGTGSRIERIVTIVATGKSTATPKGSSQCLPAPRACC